VDSIYFNPADVQQYHLVFGRVHANNGWEAMGICTGGAANPGSICFAGNAQNWYWGVQNGPNNMNTVLSLNSQGNLVAIGDVQGNRLCIGADCRNSWPSTVDTRCDTSGTCSQVCIGASCRSTWPGGTLSCVQRSNANCNVGEILTGGGAICSAADERLWASYPSETGWSAICVHADGSSGTVSNRYTICCTIS
jgi:hypothetical protein